MLYETALQLQQTTFHEFEEAREAIEKVRSVIELFEKHVYYEDRYVLPALAAHEPSAVESFEQEHNQDHILGRQLQH